VLSIEEMTLPCSNCLMSPGQAQLIRESFAKIEPSASIAALMFYQRLFTLDPSLRALFQRDIEQQGEKLIQALRFAVDTLEAPRQLQSALESLGRRHIYYGVKESHYDTVGAALIGTLEGLLGPDFTPDVREAWSEIYTFMADTMKAAAAKAPRVAAFHPRASDGARGSGSVE
jgi:hemoglobin-like flavoprotein